MVERLTVRGEVQLTDSGSHDTVDADLDEIGYRVIQRVSTTDASPVARSRGGPAGPPSLRPRPQRRGRAARVGASVFDVAEAYRDAFRKGVSECERDQ